MLSEWERDFMASNMSGPRRQYQASAATVDVVSITIKTETRRRGGPLGADPARRYYPAHESLKPHRACVATVRYRLRPARGAQQSLPAVERSPSVCLRRRS